MTRRSLSPTEALYLANATELLHALRGVAETVRSVLLIGHNPGMHELALALIGTRALASPDDAARRLVAGYPTAALAEFAIAGAWSHLDAGGGRLTRFLTPRELERAA